MQARGQIDWSRALKWGIAHICTSNTFGVKTKYIKKWVFQFLRFFKEMEKSLYKSAKNAKIRKLTLFVLNHISYDIWVTKTTIPNFEAIDYLFWLLAWCLSLGVILSDVWTKMSVANFHQHSL